MDVSATDWEQFLAQWDLALAPSSEATDNEGAVESFAKELIRLLDWSEANLAWKESLTIQVGSSRTQVYPDAVIAASKEATKQPGGVYAVIELKRRGLADESARAQAQSYADPLRAPVYAVIDGERIQVWHRRIVEADKLELEVGRQEFRTRFDEVRDLLGRAQLTRLHEDLTTRDEVDEARKRVGNIDHAPKLLRLALRDGKIWSDHARAELVNVERWWGSPVTRAPDSARLEIIGSYSDWKLGARDLVDVLVRVRVHAPSMQLAVDEPDRWRDELREASLNLEFHHASEPEPSADLRQAPPIAAVDLEEPNALATELSAYLDEWMVAAVGYSADEVKRSGAWSAVADRLGTLTLDATWLRSTLRASRQDAVHAKQRFGPKMITYLVDAALYSNAVSMVLGDLTTSARPDFPHNLDFAGAGPSEGIGFTYAPGEVRDLKAEAYLLLLPASSLTAAHGPRRIGEPPGHQVRTTWRIDDRKDHHRILCCFSEDARGCLSGGWEKFEAHLKEEIQNQNALLDP